MQWTAADIPDLTGKTAVVTGANSGIGFPAALEMAKHGADVVLACRSQERGEEAVARIEKEAPGRARYQHLDLADLDGVAAFAEQAPDQVDLLVNNAGIMMTPFWRTKQGYEAQWGINVVGHAALTHHLIDRITDRVVTVSSIAHQRGAIDFDSFQREDGYQPWTAYSQSKLGDLLFALELDRRLQAAGSKVRSVACHPGVSLTRLARNMPLRLKLGMVLYIPFLQSAARGALPTLYAATADVPGGSYWGPSGRNEWRGTPGPAKVFPHAQDEALAAKVFDAVWPEVATKTLG